MNVKKVLFLFLSVVVLQIEPSTTESWLRYDSALSGLQRMADLGYLAATGPRNLLRVYNVKNYDLIDLARQPDSFANRMRIKDLLEAGADPDAVDADGSTALVWAVYPNNLEIVKILLWAGADPNAASTRGNTALIWAVACDRSEIVKMLLWAGADPNAVSTRGNTALIVAADFRLWDICEMLLRAGADSAIVNNAGRTAVDIAIAKGYVGDMFTQNYRRKGGVKLPVGLPKIR